MILFLHGMTSVVSRKILAQKCSTFPQPIFGATKSDELRVFYEFSGN